MKKWRCVICNYIHEGENPPDSCPVCGVGKDEFVLLEENQNHIVPKTVQLSKGNTKRWKCIVCDYVHEGENPPDVCPWCGVGPDKFVLLTGESKVIDEEVIKTSDKVSAIAVTDSISYGLYVLTAFDGEKINGQCINTLIQLTVEPLQVMVSVSKNTLTTEMIKKNGVYVATLLGREHMELVKIFGYKSGRKVDKFAGIDYIKGKNGCPIIKDCLGYLECKVVQTIDVGTHYVFVSEVTAGSLAEVTKPLTYEFYREQNKKK